MTTKDGCSGFFLEAHFVHGLAPLVQGELRHSLKHKLRVIAPISHDTMRFALIDDLYVLNQIRTVTAFYVGQHFAIPRPKALLGEQHFRRLLQQLALAQRASPPRAFTSFRVDAAGSDSTIFRRLRREIAAVTNLMDDPEEGQLLIRVFPDPDASQQWTVLCRLTPKPLSARSWRVVDMPGALNATIAAAMIHLSQPQATDRFVNLMCGSGTLLIERLLIGGAALAVGCDLSVAALAAAEANINAAGLTGRVTLLHQDATQLALPRQSFNVLIADLPWGQLVGDHAQNEELYPRLLKEAARLALPGARFVLLTTEMRLLEACLHQQAHLWELRESIKLEFKNLRLRLYLLQRSILFCE